MGGQTFNGPRGNMFLFDPAELHIVGLDSAAEPTHPLYDERIKLPLSEMLVLNIMLHGVLKPVLVRKGPSGRPEVIDGRQRVRAAREANRRFVEQGIQTMRVPGVVRRDEDKAVFGIAVSANELRQGDQLMAKARKAQRYLDMGHSEDEAAVEFGVTTQSISNWLKLLELAPAVMEAVSAGQIRASAAVALHGMPFEAQEGTLKKLLGTGEKPTQRAVQKQRGDDRPAPPSKRTLNKIVTAKQAGRHLDNYVLLGIKYAMGLVAAERVSGLSTLLREIESEKKKPAKKVKA